MMHHKNRETMSAQERYVYEHRRKHFNISLLRLMILAVFLILWEISARTGLIDSFFFASPSLIAVCFWNLIRGNSLMTHLGASILEVLLSFF